MPTKNKIQVPDGLQFKRHFTTPDVNAFDMFEYDYRTSLSETPVVRWCLK